MTDTKAGVSEPLQNRNELIARARAFLYSLQVQHQDTESKRAFLREKGLTEVEIDDLLRASPSQIPNIPPRTYPLPPPSKLPVLLLGLARLYSWIAGGSAVLLFIYHGLFLPRIVRTSSARHSLRSYHLSLLRQLTTSLASLKESQAEDFSVLPRPDPWQCPPTTPLLLKSMAALRSSLPNDPGDRKSPFQYTFQSLSDFTGYVSAQVYLPYRPGFPNTTNTVDDEVRREIKALKGLVLNRRSFMPKPMFLGSRTTP